MALNKIKRAGSILVGMVALGCSTPSTASSPTPVPQINGHYIFAIFPAASCTGFGVGKFSWNVNADFSNNSGVYVVHINLPSPTPSLSITLTYNVDVLNPAIAQGSLATPIGDLSNPAGVPIPGTNTRFNTTAPLTGTVVAATDGRGIIQTGTLVGDLEVIDQTNTIVDSCSAATHLWTLTEF